MLKGKCVLVTGSTGGIGQAHARAFAAEGCNVMLNGLGDPAQIERDRAAIASEFGVEVRFCDADLSKADEIGRLVRETEAALGPVDILINNAVVRHIAPIEEFPPEKWDAALAINLSAAFHTIRLTVAGMKARGWGRIVNMASIYGYMGTLNRVNYLATKHAMIGLTRGVALETASSGVTCNAICPGSVLTPYSGGLIEKRAAEQGISWEESEREFMAARQPTGRIIRGESIASMAVYLCGHAARDITGACMTIDGAWSIQR